MSTIYNFRSARGGETIRVRSSHGEEHARAAAMIQLHGKPAKGKPAQLGRGLVLLSMESEDGESSTDAAQVSGPQG